MAERNVSKQRRAAQNKAARESLANRTTRAAQGPKVSAEAATAAAAPVGRTRGRIKAPVGQGGRPARTAPARQARPPSNPISKFLADVQAQPGGKAITFAFVFSIVAAFLILFTKEYPVALMYVPQKIITTYRTEHHLHQPGISKKAQFGKVYAYGIIGWFTFVVALAPIVITATTMVLLSTGRNVRRTLTGAMVSMLVILFLSQQLVTLLIFSVGGVLVAFFQARKADPPALKGWRARAAVAEAEGDGEEDEDGDYEPDDDA